MTIIDRLPPSEWWRLAETDLAEAVPHLDPASTHVVAVEDDGVIVGCWALVRIPHAEGVWVAPSHRGRGRVAAKLLSAMRSAVRQAGIAHVWTAAVTDDVRRLIDHLGGAELPGRHFILPLGD